VVASGILFGIRDINLCSSKTISSKLVYDLDMNKVCSNKVSKCRSSKLCTSSLGKHKFFSR
jgi:hypothetical protein